MKNLIAPAFIATLLIAGCSDSGSQSSVGSVASTVGGALFDHSGYRSAFVASAVVLLAAALLSLMTSRAQTSRVA